MDILTFFVTYTLATLVTNSELHGILGVAIHHDTQGSTLNKAVLTHGINVFVPIAKITIYFALI
jgi:hypothetical protein